MKCSFPGTLRARSHLVISAIPAIDPFTDLHLYIGNRPDPSIDAMCWRYLSSRVGQLLRPERSRGSAFGARRPEQSGGLSQAQKSPSLSTEAVCWRYPSSWVGQVLSWRSNSPVDCCSQNCAEIRKESSLSLTLLYVGVTYLPGQSPAKYCRRK